MFTLVLVAPGTPRLARLGGGFLGLLLLRLLGGGLATFAVGGFFFGGSTYIII